MHGLGVDQTGQFGQCPQRHRERERLVGGQPDRPFDAGIERDGHRAAIIIEHDIDQVVRVVPGQPADHQQVQVGADLFAADPELGRQLA